MKISSLLLERDGAKGVVFGSPHHIISEGNTSPLEINEISALPVRQKKNVQSKKER